MPASRKSNSNKAIAKARMRALDTFELYKSGLSYAQIAKKLDISTSTVHKDIKYVIESIKKNLSLDIGEMKLEAKERLNHLLNMALEGYEASKEFSSKKVKKISKGSGSMEEDVTVSEVEIRHGDIRFLELAKDVLVEIDDIFGLKPNKGSSVDINQAFMQGPDGTLVIKTSWNTPAADKQLAESNKAKQKLLDQKDEEEEHEEAEFEVIDDGGND